ncbi:glycine--tRNA ligase subunit beta [Phenylobacterium sp. Root700]|uniref:glycine--tRNA ligase subunit beta n=1 Tax=Phenylobacterium sp. Root700 TaxID=1736591 RepID=UPI0006FBCDF8|nr:glycine--tRNA ligase subunit beta [Phenylobacterium sp. Root700]KRB40021.1 glycine--tRNA ligase subunit beta [Phenylobacterium sp. Root700]
MPQLLIELFSEEIPARMQVQAARDFDRMVRDRLAAEGLLPEGLKTFSGPRRLTLVAEGLPVAQGDRHEDRKGPRVGAPDAAIEGFLRSTGLTRDKLVEKDGVWFAHIHRAGRPTAEIVAEILDQVIRSFPWPKSMTWGRGTLRWVRPLKRIVFIFDGEVVPFNIDGIESGDVTEGHRFMGSGKSFKVKDFDSYRDKLAGHFVILDPEERKDRIMDGARTLCFARNLELVDDDGLLDEVAGLAEWPTPVLGDMDPDFLDLPPEVIRTSMRTHQKYFAVRDPKTGKLAAHFLTVANIEAADGGKEIARGNGKVLSARLNDARFFWDEDRKVTLEQRLEKLTGVTFHAKLGTLAERVERLEILAKAIAPRVGADVAKAVLAARLSKADLATGMVGEFPELQGLMGGYYAREEKISPVVADAIRDHYRPVGASDEAPDTPVTMAVAIAEKLDTLTAFFAIDEKPTGSRDPYALRRAALGVIRILLGSEARAPVRELVADWYKSLRCYVDPGRALYVSTRLTTGYLGPKSRAPSEVFQTYVGEFEDALLEGKPYVVSTEEDFDIRFDRTAQAGEAPEGEVQYEFRPYTVVADEVLSFLADRLKVALRDQGKRHDLVDAVFALGDDDLVRIVARVEALDGFLTGADGPNLLAGYKRAGNILKAEEKKGALPAGPAVGMPGAPKEEGALIAALESAERPVAQALQQEDFAGAMRALSGLRGPVDAFFEGVLVNSESAAERENRLRLLVQVRDLMERVADFSQVTG